MVGLLSWTVLASGDMVSRRFPLERSGKERPVDDTSQSQINATATCYEQAIVVGLMCLEHLPFS